MKRSLFPSGYPFFLGDNVWRCVCLRRSCSKLFQRFWQEDVRKRRSLRPFWEDFPNGLFSTRGGGERATDFNARCRCARETQGRGGWTNLGPLHLYSLQRPRRDSEARDASCLDRRTAASITKLSQAPNH